jgi:predicted 3-demethylubiquinone-9 3-methyltransferase (glyoxalase superfamily)
MPDLGTPMITTSLWFDTQAEEAAEFYVSVFPESRITHVQRYGSGSPRPEGLAMVVGFELAGTRFSGLNGGPDFAFTEATSFVIGCRDQDEVDHYWDALTDGGSEGQCGWLKDRFGVSWQVVPNGMGAILGDPDPARSSRAMQAMLGMRKLDIAALQAAAAG